MSEALSPARLITDPGRENSALRKYDGRRKPGVAGKLESPVRRLDFVGRFDPARGLRAIFGTRDGAAAGAAPAAGVAAAPRPPTTTAARRRRARTAQAPRAQAVDQPGINRQPVAIDHQSHPSERSRSRPRLQSSRCADDGSLVDRRTADGDDPGVADRDRSRRRLRPV